MRSLLKNNKGILGVGSSMLFLILLVAAVVVISLGLVFFGGSDESTSGSEADEQEASALYQEFKNKLEDNPEYEVEYDLTYSDGDTANVVIYTKDGSTRLDIDEDGDTIHVWTNGKNVVESDGQCIDLDSASQMGFNPESIYQMSTVEGTMKSDEKYLSIDSIGTKNIAGKTTDCYEIVYETDQYNQLTTYCLSGEGIPALIETENKGTGELVSKVEAKTLESSIDESVLEPCEPNVDLSGYM